MKFHPLVPQYSICKCCSNQSILFGVCDFNKNCEERNGLHLTPSGIPIYYYRCNNCGFIFSNAFDDFSPDDFKEQIYNDDYQQVDPDYTFLRPTNLGQMIANTFHDNKDISIIDYGGGNGILAQTLRDKGFPDVSVYDPFTPQFAQKPNRKFNLLLAFEVIEHVADIYTTIEDMITLIDKECGFIITSTLLQPSDINKTKTNWWYISPRNGHISIHTQKSLTISFSKKGLHLESANQGQHCAYFQVPDFAKRIFNKT